jgi:hypothetical protein
MPDNILCPHCGTDNEKGRSFCVNCQQPFTAYCAQLTGETYQGKLAEKAARLEGRPPVVAAMALFDLLFAVFGPLAFVVGGFLNRQQANSEGTNYIGAAFGGIVVFLWALILIPLALALFGLAWATWTQRPWAWRANAAGLCAIAVFAMATFASRPIMTFIWVGLACGFAYYWFKPEVKGWFAID